MASKEDAKMGGKEQDANLGYGKQVANKVGIVAAYKRHKEENKVGSG